VDHGNAKAFLKSIREMSKDSVMVSLVYMDLRWKEDKLQYIELLADRVIEQYYKESVSVTEPERRKTSGKHAKSLK